MRTDVHLRMPRVHPKCPPGSPTFRLALTVLSIGAASHFMLYLDSVVDNLLPAAMPYLILVYGDKDIADRAWEFMVSARVSGLAIGCGITIYLARMAGRRWQCLLGTGLCISGAIFTVITIYTPAGLAAAIVGRFINGIGQGIVQTAGTVMIAELPPIRFRGTSLASLTMWACLGEVFGMVFALNSLLGNPQYWHLAQAVPLVLIVPAFCILYMSPESPRYLLTQGREEEARKALLYYQSPADAKQSLEEVQSELELLEGEDNNDQPTTATVKKRMTDGLFVRPLIVGLFVQTFVHLDDWLWISYSTQIFENYGLSIEAAQLASLFMSMPQAIMSLILLVYFDRFTRRQLLITPSAFSALIGLFVVGLVFSKPLFPWIPTHIILPVFASMDLCTAAISGESAFAVVTELFLPDDKILGTAIVGIVQNLFGSTLLTFLLTAVNKYGAAWVMIPFVLMNTIYSTVLYKKLPETGDKLPQEISRHFSKDLPGAKFVLGLKHIYSQANKSSLFRTSIHAIAIFLQAFILFIVFRAGIDMYRYVYSLV